MVSSQRIEYIDLAKGFCIIFVVMLHICNYYDIDFWLTHKITAFRIPLYYFLSGVFFKSYNGFNNFLKKKTNKLLIPFLFFYLTTSCLLKYIVIISLGGGNTSLTDLLFSIYYHEESFSNSAIWFLLSLFIVNLFFYFVFSVTNLISRNKTTFVICCSMIIGFVGLLLSYYKINLPFYIDSSLTALPFFMAGFIIKNKTDLMIPNKLDKYTFWVILICFAIVCAFSDGRMKFITNFYSQQSYITLYPLGLIGTIGILYCAKYITHLPFISYLGRYSIIVLVTHELIFPNLKPVVSLIVGGKMVEIQFMMTLILTLIVCFLLIPIMKRFLPYVTAQKDVFK